MPTVVRLSPPPLKVQFIVPFWGTRFRGELLFGAEAVRFLFRQLRVEPDVFPQSLGEAGLPGGPD